MAGVSDLHISGLLTAVSALDVDRLRQWGAQLGSVLSGGGRLLVAGNGGSAAQAQHLTAELVGRFEVSDRRPLSAIALHADTSSVTAIANDYGFDEVFARQVAAHGRDGDVLMVLSTSGRSRNLQLAVVCARRVGMVVWGLTGRTPNPLAGCCDEAVAVEGPPSTVQECHLVAIHVLCGAVDDGLTTSAAPRTNMPWAPPGRSVPAAGGAGASAAERGARQRLVIVGDVLLDETIDAEITRFSPEGPVPVAENLHRSSRPGGAGLAALVAAAAGHDVVLVTALGADVDAELLRSMLIAADVGVIEVGTSCTTAVKTRVRVGDRTLIRLDRADPAQPCGPVPAAALDALRTAAAVVVCDYGRGIAAADDLRTTLSQLPPRVPVVWDPHPRGAWPVSGVILTPNRDEAAGLVGTPGTGGGLAADISNARRLRRLWRCGHVALTRGADGALLVSDDAGPPLLAAAPAVQVRDTTGAGDAFAVTLAAGLAAGSLPSQVLPRAVTAAAEFVATGLDDPGQSAPSGDAVALARAVRERGGTVIATGGCFDLLHRGHVTALEQARRLGDCLIVCLNGDASTSRLKGPTRPLMAAEDRRAVLQALACVDAVLIFDEDTPAAALARLRPHIFAKGGDYALADLPERPTVEAGGGSVVLLPYLDGRSTSLLIERVARGATGTPPTLGTRP